MQLRATNVTAAPSDRAVQRSVERALADLRCGAPIVMEGHDGRAALVQAAETISNAGLTALIHLAGPRSQPLLLLTERRAAALGLPLQPASGGVIALALLDRQAERIAELSDPARTDSTKLRRSTTVPAPQGLSAAAIDLAKLARLLPSALIVELALDDKATAADWAVAHDLLRVAADDVAAYRLVTARALRPVAEARVPLEGAEDTRVIAFRPEDGGVEHLALIIGTPSTESPLLVRLHSECFTGDLLGSLRCDCGDQLRGAIHAIGAAGSGAILYLNQEGRGIGLINKLRAYALQDDGADTAEANETIGFDADERHYLPAAEMLRQLGHSKVRLMTNNPQKIAALERCGIEVAERVPHSFPANGHNEFYLATKAARLGHLF